MAYHIQKSAIIYHIYIVPLLSWALSSDVEIVLKIGHYINVHGPWFIELPTLQASLQKSILQPRMRMSSQIGEESVATNLTQ
jgi:hypothetical protein